MSIVKESDLKAGDTVICKMRGIGIISKRTVRTITIEFKASQLKYSFAGKGFPISDLGLTKPDQ